MAVENVVMIYEVGNGKGCDHGKSRFVIDTALNDTRLIGLIPPEKFREKFEAVNEGFGKRAAPWYIWLFQIPMALASIYFFLQLKKEVTLVRCTNITQVCSMDTEYDLSTCNKFWCCPHGFNEDADKWSSKGFTQAGCVALAGSEPLGAYNNVGQGESTMTMAELCEENVLMTQCKCKEGGKECGVIRIEVKMATLSKLSLSVVKIFTIYRVKLLSSWDG